jgi:hypothetical protein
MSEPQFCDNWESIVKKVSKTPFLTGNGPRGWKADVDWFLKDDNYIKVMEGKYDDFKAETVNQSIVPAVGSGPIPLSPKERQFMEAKK